MIRAYVWASGLIEFGAEVPKGACGVALLESQEEADKLRAKCRLSYSKKSETDVWFVPGIPEAKSEDEAIAALMYWVYWAVPRDRLSMVVNGREIDLTLANARPLEQPTLH